MNKFNASSVTRWGRRFLVAAGKPLSQIGIKTIEARGHIYKKKKGSVPIIQGYIDVVGLRILYSHII